MFPLSYKMLKNIDVVEFAKTPQAESSRQSDARNHFEKKNKNVTVFARSRAPTIMRLSSQPTTSTTRKKTPKGVVLCGGGGGN